MARWIAVLLFFAAVMAISVLILISLTTASFGKIMAFCVSLAVIMAVGFLSARYPQVDRTVKAAFAGYFRICGWLLLSLAPVTGFSWLSKFVLGGRSLWFQVVVLVLWGVLLGAALLMVSTEHYREQLFQRLQTLGGFAPFVYCFNVLVISITFFGSATYLLAINGRLAFSIPTGQALHSGMLLDFFLWHFLSAIPLLDVTDTLRWSIPVGYKSAGVGWILLLFKIVVIGPVIAAFAGYWKFRRR